MPGRAPIADRQEIDAASRAACDRLCRRLTATRLRLAALVGLALEAAALIVNVAFATDRVAARLGALGAETALSLGLLCWIAHRRRSRDTRPVAAAYVLAQGGVLLYQLTLSPGDVDALTSPVTWVIMGSMLFFPWGAATQAIISGVLLGGYLAALWPHLGVLGMRGANVALSLGVGSVLSVVGARILDRSRLATCAERRRGRALAVQRRRLIDVGRDLRSTLAVDTIKERLAAHAARLIPTDGLMLALADADEGTYRVVAATGGVASLLDLEWEPRFAAALRAAFPPAEVRECPGGVLDPLVMPVIGALGMQRVLVAVIGPHPAPAGFLAWHRREPRAFSPGERLAAQGIADQAFTALCGARLYEASLRASRVKSEFVSTMSHELRTPLNVIVGYNQMLRDILPTDGEPGQALDAVRRASLELLDLVEATLDLGRLESGAERVRDEPVAIRGLFDELAAEFAAVPRAADVSLHWDAGDNPRPVTDRRKLKTVLRNLVANALKFTPAGSVRVECRRSGQRCQLRVIDTGIGIRREDQAVIFEMFRQVDGSDSRRYGGAGLGLHIVRQLVQMLGGEVAVESAPGQGSVFSVTIPLRAGAATPQRSAA